MTALMLPIFFGMVAFAVDTNWIVTTQSQLQNAADSAALAGAQQLFTSYALYNLPGQTQQNKNKYALAASTAARSVAISYAAANSAGGVASLKLLDGDVNVGFTDSSGAFTAYASGGSYPNTVKVLLRRDSMANTALNLFFGPVIGTRNISLTTTATASLYTGVVKKFDLNSGVTKILPFTYDKDHWLNFVKDGRDPDGNITKASNGDPEIQVYPSTKYKGNFGQLSLNSSNVGTSTQIDWLNNGVPSSDISALNSAGFLPLSPHTDPYWQGSTGFASSLVQATNDDSIIGQTYWLPLFEPVTQGVGNYQAGTGSGNYYNYNIVAFVPVTVMQPTNKNKQVVLQPAVLSDGFAVFDPSNMQLAGTSSSSYATLMPPRLSN